jgi:DnaJ-class molecular chaperone
MKDWYVEIKINYLDKKIRVEDTDQYYKELVVVLHEILKGSPQEVECSHCYGKGTKLYYVGKSEDDDTEYQNCIKCHGRGVIKNPHKEHIDRMLKDLCAKF